MQPAKTMEDLCQYITDNQTRLYRLAYSYVRNKQDALDVMQDVTYKLLKNAHRIKNPAYIDTWLYRVTINTSIDLLRRRDGQKRLRTEQAAAGPGRTDPGTEDNYALQELTEALDQLDANSQAIIILRYFEDKTLQQVADILQMNLNTVKTRLYKALRTLKIRLADEEDEKNVYQS